IKNRELTTSMTTSEAARNRSTDCIMPPQKWNARNCIVFRGKGKQAHSTRDSVCRTQQAVPNGSPFRLVGREFHGDPIETLVVEVMQRAVQLRGVHFRLFWHALASRSHGIVVQPKIGAAAFAGQVPAIHQHNARPGAVVLAMLPRRTVRFSL